MEPKKVELNLAGRNFKIEAGFLKTQAQGTVTVSLGDTVILTTAIMKEEVNEEIDFFPLLVDFEERFYAVGKIKGSRFWKREGRPSDSAVLAARLIDRPLRPLFPKGMINEVQIVCTVLSADLEVDPDATAITAASAALLLSGIPFNGPVAGVGIGLITDSEGKEQLIVNPTYEQCEKGKLDLVVAGTKDAITMVEAGAKEVKEEVLLSALELAHRHIRKLCVLQEELKKQVEVKVLEPAIYTLDPELKKAVLKFIKPEMLQEVQAETKQEFKEKVHLLEDKLLEHFKKEIEEEVFKERNLRNALTELLTEKMRQNILKGEKRIDGRKLTELRPISCQVGVLPRTHGSALFRRGETWVLSLTTLGSPGSAQLVETMEEETSKRFMHHYNFPPFSTGEVKPLRGVSRREIGHGYLAERALVPMIPEKEEFPYTLRVVSEVLSCNGSSSMASVCASSLSLMDAGVLIKKAVAGVALGLIAEDKNPAKSYKILTDIQGLEDFGGDMDFKIAGTEEGITTLQMDTKVSGLTLEILRVALKQAKEGRLEILKKMNEVIGKPRPELSKYAPLITSLKILPEQIREVIGRGGETIQKITAECGVEIDIEQDGLVMITAPDQESGEKALKWIKDLTYLPKPGDVFEGKVVRIMEFGAFVEFMPGKEGLVHISELAPYRVNRVEDIVKMGDSVKVKLLEIDEQGRYNLSHKALLPRSESSFRPSGFPRPSGYSSPPPGRPPRPERPRPS